MTTLEKLETLIYEGFKDTDRKFQDTDRKFQDTDRKLWEQSGRTEQELRKLSREIGKITDSLGRFAENMVAPAVVRLFNQIGIPITDYAQRVYSDIGRTEYDVVAFNSEYIVVVSVKMTLNVEDVKEFLTEKLPAFKRVFPRYKDMNVLGVVAGANLVGESHIYAMKRGLYVLAQSGENMTMLNDDTFTPTVF